MLILGPALASTQFQYRVAPRVTLRPLMKGWKNLPHKKKGSSRCAFFSLPDEPSWKPLSQVRWLTESVLTSLGGEQSPEGNITHHYYYEEPSQARGIGGGGRGQPGSNDTGRVGRNSSCSVIMARNCLIFERSSPHAHHPRYILVHCRLSGR